MDMKTAIETGDVSALRQTLAEDPTLANALIRWGTDERCLTHPLHYVSDMLFAGILQRGKELPVVEALIQSGADLNVQRYREDARKSESPLIGAASLGAEEVGLALLDAGAQPDLRGLFGETALHWAALLGEDRLVKRLIPCVDLNLKDEKYKSPPLGWAIHGLESPPAWNPGKHLEVIELLVAAGAMVERRWLTSEKVRANPTILTALQTRAQELG